ncbi:MAG: ABC transporter substrate-binding protein, partial [Chloroflexota bacterium]
LQLLIGDKKNDWIIERYHGGTPLATRADHLVPQWNRYWFDPNIPSYSYDPAKAYEMLTDAGFSNTTGHWIAPNGEEMRHMYVLSPPELDFLFFSQVAAEALNSFFGVASEMHPTHPNKPYFEWECVGAGSLVVGYYNRDYDLFCCSIFFGGRDIEYLYDVLHPKADAEGSYNTAGLVCQPLDDYLWALKFGRNATTGEFIADVQELREIGYEVQWMLYNGTGGSEAACPYIPLMEYRYASLFCPNLKEWIDSSGYGAAPCGLEMPWTYVNISWKSPTHCRFVRWNPTAQVIALHPGTTDWYGDKYVLNRLFDSLLVVDPYTHKDVPWATTRWAMEAYVNESENVYNGMNVTFWLRRGICWHDGDPVTADDVVWNFDFINSIGKTGGFTSLSKVWKDYIKSENIGTYTLAVYLNTTGLWNVYDLSENALKFPKQIWQPYWGNKTAAEAFHPWETPHPTITGLTSLIGTGPYIFVEWNTTANYIHLHANRAGYPRTGLPGYWGTWS